MNLRPVLFIALLSLSACGGGSGGASSVETGVSGGSGASSSSSSTGNTPAPTVNLTASTTSITAGGSATLTWSSTDAVSCTASGAWSGTKATSGSATVSPTSTSTYTLSCTGSGWTPSQSVTITVQSDSSITAASASTLGPYTVGTFTSGIAGGADYVVPKIYYPTNATAPYPGVVFITGNASSYTENPYTVKIGGKTVVEADVVQWGTFLASHGFAVLFVDAANYTAGPTVREKALTEGVNALAGENTRSASPLFGKLSVNKIAAMGHSYGGAGAMFTADDGNSHIAAILALSPVAGYASAFGSDTLPTMVISAVGDPYESNFPQQFASIPSATPKILANFKQSSEWESMHAIALTPLGTHTTDADVARLGLSFLEVYLYGDTRYKPFIVNDATNMANFSYVNP